VSYDKIHWLAVGEVSERAKNAVKNVGGQVQQVDTGPVPIFLVGIPCKLLPAHTVYTDFHVRTWTGSEDAIIEVRSQRLELSWSCQSGTPPTEASISETTLDLYQEEE